MSFFFFSTNSFLTANFMTHFKTS